MDRRDEQRAVAQSELLRIHVVARARGKIAITDDVIDKWRKANVGEDFIAKVLPLKNRALERAEFFAALERHFRWQARSRNLVRRDVASRVADGEWSNSEPSPFAPMVGSAITSSSFRATR